jgi:ATP-grasp domain, R2K clade family 3
MLNQVKRICHPSPLPRPHSLKELLSICWYIVTVCLDCLLDSKRLEFQKAAGVHELRRKTITEELMDTLLTHAELLEIENSLWVLAAPTGIANYDFDFASFFSCRHPWRPPDSVLAAARVGAIANYEAVYAALAQDGIRLLHTPQEYLRASELPHWYPLIRDLTPRSIWATTPPDPEQITSELGWPIFLKGVRQTCHHRRSLSIIENPEQLKQALTAYASDPILRWQGFACREYVRLRLVEDQPWDRLPSAFEFRTFWWKGNLVGWGRYWCEGKSYQPSEREAAEGLAVAREAAGRLQIPFLVVDIAQTESGRWLVIECNDGQESGYGAVSPVGLWQKIVDLEKS